jgi:hypothetical protein
MYVVSYRYQVPPESEAAYVDLQRRVARLYLDAGCRRYAILKPRTPGEPWQELSFYENRLASETAEAKLTESGALDELFEEFLRLTRLQTSDLTPVAYELALEMMP